MYCHSRGSSSNIIFIFLGNNILYIDFHKEQWTNNWRIVTSLLVGWIWMLWISLGNQVRTKESKIQIQRIKSYPIISKYFFIYSKLLDPFLVIKVPTRIMAKRSIHLLKIIKIYTSLFPSFFHMVLIFRVLPSTCFWVFSHIFARSWEPPSFHLPVLSIVLLFRFLPPPLPLWIK